VVVISFEAKESSNLKKDINIKSIARFWVNFLSCMLLTWLTCLIYTMSRLELYANIFIAGFSYSNFVSRITLYSGLQYLPSDSYITNHTSMITFRFLWCKLAVGS